MYLYKKDALRLIESSKENILSEMKEKFDFLLPLLECDDWTMIVKCHSLIEEIVTNLITAHTNETKLRKFFKRLPLSDKKIGKIAIAKEFGLLTQSECGFIIKFSTLRNDLVHNYKNTDFNLDDYLESLDKNQKKSWYKVINWFDEDNDIKSGWHDLSLSMPKVALWFSIYMFISLKIINENKLKGISELQKVAISTTENLLSESV